MGSLPEPKSRISVENWKTLFVQWDELMPSLYTMYYGWHTGGMASSPAPQTIREKLPPFGIDAKDKSLEFERRVLEDFRVKARNDNILIQFSSLKPGSREVFAEQHPRLPKVFEELVLKHPLLTIPREGFAGYAELFVWQDMLHRKKTAAGFNPEDTEFQIEEKEFDAALYQHTCRIYFKIATSLGIELDSKPKPGPEMMDYMYKVQGFIIFNSIAITRKTMRLFNPNVPRYNAMVEHRA